MTGDNRGNHVISFPRLTRYRIRPSLHQIDVLSSVDATTHRYPKSILVAEDDRGIRGQLKLILERDDWDILLARDGVEALHLARRHAFDLVFVDLHMPGLDGAGFCRAYRERGGDAPVVMLSAASDGPATARDCAADGFISKPFQIATVLATADRHLNHAPLPQWHSSALG